MIFRKSIYYFLLFVCLGFSNTYAQPYETNPDINRTRNWHFGDGVGLRFDPDTIYEVQTSIQDRGAASVHTDQDGNLLLYSNGEKIWNANHEVIHNGNLSLGNRLSTSGSVFVFQEDNPNYIYLFSTNNNQSTTKEFSVNLIVREADTFRVAYKDSVLMYNVCESIAAIKADNGRDVWITVHEFGANNMYSYLLTSRGIVSCPVVSKSFSTPFGSPHAAFFTMVYSSDGNYMAKANTNQDFSITKRVELYSFNSESGRLKFLYSLDSLSYFVRGLRFGKDNSSLYVVERDSGVNIYKFNPTDSLATAQSRKKILLNEYSFSLQNIPYDYGMALSRVDTFTQMDFIIPINGTDSVKILEKQINLNAFVGVGFPNFNQSYFYTPSINFTMKLNCAYNTIQFYGQDTFNANNHNWFISKQGSIPITNNSKTPLIEFSDTGEYQVRYIASNGSRSDTINKQVTIYPQVASGFLGNDTGWCASIDNSFVLTLPENLSCYEWSNGSDQTEITVDTAGVFWARIITPGFCVIYDTVNIYFDTVPNAPIVFMENDSILKTDGIYHTYQWYRNDIPVGTNQPTLILNDTGIYYLQIKTNGGCTAISDTIHILAEKDTLNDNVSKVIIDGIKIYPNPFNSSVVIENPNLEDFQLTIYSIEGRETLNIRLQNDLDVINTEQWTAGIYLVKP